ncbi:MAG: DUF1289 domain-containing protein [Betaproteobacteria bacterium]
MSDARSAQPGVASPCASLCTMDAVSGLCIGCARTLDEIASWSALDDDARRAIVEALPARQWRIASARAVARGRTR